jgi:peptide deformylase
VKLKLRYYGDPVLRKKAEPIKEITPEIVELALAMKKMVDDDDNAIGLAAPQVGYSLRIFVSNVEGMTDDGEVIVGQTRVYINPVITNRDSTIVEQNEACLSIPDVYGPVPRPYSCDIEAMDENGDVFSHHCEDFLTRNILHEYDHLEGVLWVDYVKGRLRTLIDKDLRKIKKRYYNSAVS